jgi:hypothetical protein
VECGVWAITQSYTEKPQRATEANWGFGVSFGYRAITPNGVLYGSTDTIVPSKLLKL